MKKIGFVLILGVLVISMLGLVFAVQGNGSQGNNSGGEDANQVGMNNNETGNENVVIVNKTRIEKENLIFSPWQQRDELECLEGCFIKVLLCLVKLKQER